MGVPQDGRIGAVRPTKVMSVPIYTARVHITTHKAPNQMPCLFNILVDTTDVHALSKMVDYYQSPKPIVPHQ